MNDFKNPTATIEPIIINVWDKLTFPQQLFLTTYVCVVTGGRMIKTLAAFVVTLFSAAAIFAASNNWIIALAVGILIGWLVSELLRTINRKK